MPIKGLPPKENPRHRMPRHDFIEVENVPNTRAMKLVGKWSRNTRRWYRIIAQMPHCRLWSKTDWLFAIESAMVAEQFYRTKSAVYSKELRAREAIMGVTADARRALRIRYVEPVEEDEEEAENNVVSLEERIRAIE